MSKDPSYLRWWTSYMKKKHLVKSPYNERKQDHFCFQEQLTSYAVHYVPLLYLEQYYLIAGIVLTSLGGVVVFFSFCGCCGACAVKLLSVPEV